MSCRFLQRGTIVVLTLAGLARSRSAKKLGAAEASLANPSPATRQTTGGAASRPHNFSRAYDYCYVDADGRPVMFHRKRLAFFLPDSPQEVNDWTFIESDSCQESRSIRNAKRLSANLARSSAFARHRHDW